MTEIYEVSGLKGIAGAVQRSAPDSRSDRGYAEEVRQRGALVKPRPIVDTAALSEGEMLVELVRQRMAMLADFYPDFPQYRAAATMGENALYQGLHTGMGVGAWTKILDPIQQEMAWAILEGKGQTDPASGWLPWDSKARTLNDGGIAIGAIPLRNCEQEFPYVDPNQFPGQNWPATHNMEQGKKRQACQKENDWRKILNEKYEDSAHHPLYNFITNPNQMPGVVAAKTVNHTNAIQALSSISKISYTNLKQWQTNGIISKNISRGVGSLGPQESIEGLRTMSAEGIGLEPATISALVLLGKVIIGAITAAGGLILAIKGKDQAAAETFKAVAQGWGSGDQTIKGTGYGGYTTDWDSGTGGGGSNPGGSGSGNQGGGGGNDTDTGSGGSGFDLNLDNLSGKQIATGLGVAALGWWALSK
jgi:hypothetical protein